MISETNQFWTIEKSCFSLQDVGLEISDYYLTLSELFKLLGSRKNAVMTIPPVWEVLLAPSLQAGFHLLEIFSIPLGCNHSCQVDKVCSLRRVIRLKYIWTFLCFKIFVGASVLSSKSVTIHSNFFPAIKQLFLPCPVIVSKKLNYVSKWFSLRGIWHPKAWRCFSVVERVTAWFTPAQSCSNLWWNVKQQQPYYTSSIFPVLDF